MKKSELKDIIKECVKEVIFEEGTLSSIISEVVQGLGTPSLVQEQSRQPRSSPAQGNITETRQQMLAAVASNSYEDAKQRFSNPEMFEGTKPLAESNGKGAALSGVSPGDSGVDITNIPGFGNWSNVAASRRK